MSTLRKGLIVISNDANSRIRLVRFSLLKYYIAGTLITVFILVNIFALYSYLNNVEKLKSEMEHYTAVLEKKRSEFADNYRIYTKLETIANMKQVIRKVNPLIDDSELSAWIIGIRENARLLDGALSKASRERFEKKGNLEEFDLNTALVLSMGAYESDFRADIVSHKGAKGGFQLMAVTASAMNVNDRNNISENINAGVEYFSRLLKRFKDDPDQIELAVAAYNAGITRVKRDWIGNWGSSWEDIHHELKKARVFNETRYYVDGVLKFTNILTEGSWVEAHPLFWQSFRTFIFANNSIYPDATSNNP